MMRHDLSIYLGKDGLRSNIEAIMDCFRQDEEAEHEYHLHIVDLQDDDDDEDDNVITFNNLPDACRFLCFIYKALRKGYEACEKGGIDV